MKRAILTGFQPFGRYSVNPTQLVAQQLDGTTVADHCIHSLVFPTTVLSPTERIDRGREIVKKFFEVKASVIISLGIASEANGVRVETVCVNWVEHARYCTSFENGKPLCGDHEARAAKEMSFERWNMGALGTRLSAAGIPWEMSKNAGSYCCNALMFWMLRACASSFVNPPFLFAHVACTEEAIAGIPDFDRMNKVLLRHADLRLVVEAMLQSYS